MPRGTWPFTSSPLTLVDEDFGKEQLDLMLRDHYLHPNGQLPAYEWNFGDVNPPVHAWSTIFTYTPAKTRADGEGGHRLARALVPEAAAELHLVGEPQGPLRQQRLRRRLPRPRQHRRVRSQRAAADGRLPGAGRRHGVDGAVLPEHAARSSIELALERPGLRRDGAQVRRALPLDRVGDAAPARARECGTRRTASSTTCCVCPTAARSGSRSARWSACCRCAR